MIYDGTYSGTRAGAIYTGFALLGESLLLMGFLLLAMPRRRRRRYDRLATNGHRVGAGVRDSAGSGRTPADGGALAKLAVKDPLGYGIAGTLATLSAAGTTLLMLHFLHRLAAAAAQDAAKVPPARLVVPWLSMAVASSRSPGYCALFFWPWQCWPGIDKQLDSLAEALL